MHYRRVQYFGILALWCIWVLVSRAAMQSEGFRIESESLNVGGVEIEGSANFLLSETIGENISGDSRSNTFEVRAGYRGFVGITPSPAPTPIPGAPSTPTPAPAGGGILPPGGLTAFNAIFEIAYIGDTSALITWSGTQENTATLFYGTTEKVSDFEFRISDFSLTHTFALTNLAPETTYFLKITSQDRFGAKLETTIFSFTTQCDATPPANVRNFRALPSDRAISLSWKNPPDADFAGVRIRRDKLRNPRSPEEGKLVYDGRDEKVGDRNLENSVTYYYTVFTYDAAGNFSSGAAASGAPSSVVTPKPTPSPTPIPTPTLLPTPTPVPTPIIIYPSPTPVVSPVELPRPPIVPKEHVELSDFSFEAQTEFGYLEFPLTEKDKLEFITSQNFKLSISQKIFAKPVELAGLAFNGDLYFLRVNPKTGAYEAVITAPPQKEKGALNIFVQYEDGSRDELKSEVTVDPYGYVYQRVRGQQLWLADVKVTLEECDLTYRHIDISKYQGAGCALWPGAQFRQRNPHMTGETGEYYFLVKPGVYRLIVEKPGYRLHSQLLTVERTIINANIELKPLRAYSRFLDAFWEIVRRDWLFVYLLLLILAALIIAAVVLYRSLPKPRSIKIAVRDGNQESGITNQGNGI